MLLAPECLSYSSTKLLEYTPYEAGTDECVTRGAAGTTGSVGVRGSIVRDVCVDERSVRGAAHDRPWGLGGETGIVAPLHEVVGARRTRRGSRQKRLGQVASGESVRLLAGTSVSRRPHPMQGGHLDIGRGCGGVRKVSDEPADREKKS